jgi:hypothetical protein
MRLSSTRDLAFTTYVKVKLLHARSLRQVVTQYVAFGTWKLM